MKKIIALVTAVAWMIVLFAGCDGPEEDYLRQKPALFRYSMYEQLPQGSQEPSPEQAELLEGFAPTEDNGALRLYLQEETGNIALFDKRSGRIYFNVVPHAEADSTATEDTKKRMQSALELTYFDGSVEKTVNSFELSDPERLNCEAIDGGVRVTYLLGDSKRSLEDLPQKLSDERFRELFVDHPNLKENDKKRAKIYYKQEEDTGIWVLKDTKNTTVNFLSQILDRIGYTDEDLKKDNDEHGLTTNVSNRLKFVIPVEYTLEGESLRVSVDMEKVQYTESKPLLTICVNRYFGATADRSGAIVLPEGTGGLMRFSQGETDTGAYSSSLYGSDDTYTREDSARADNQNMLPLFGLYGQDAGYLCIIEEGDALAVIGAEKANGNTDLNSAWVSFSVRSFIRAILGDGSLQSDVRVVQDEMYTGLLSYKYSFINGENLSYDDLATYYRGYLMAKYGLAGLEKDIMPLQLTLTGGVHIDQSFLGFRYKGTRKLTTYTDAMAIVEDLQTQGIERLNVLYSGILKGGLGREHIAKLKLDGALGSLEELRALAEKEGVSMYLTVNALTLPKDASGYNRYTQTAKTMDDGLSKRYRFNMVDLTTDGYDYILSPLYYGYYGEKLLAFVEKNGLDGIAFTDLGGRIYSHNGDSILFRQDTKALSLAQLQQYSAGTGLILTDPIESALPYAGSVVDLPTAKVSKVIDQAIPFYQMAIHGLVDYAGAPINEAVDVQSAILDCVQTGSVPYFSLFAAAQDSLTDTEFSHMYSHGYDTWRDTVINVYSRLAELYAQVGDLPITDHICLKKGVYKTVYGDSVVVYTNYNSAAVTVEGITVDGENYRMEVLGS
jgi:hypothetical protein